MCAYSFYEIVVNTGTSWALYPTNWLTDIDPSNYKKYEEQAFLLRRTFRTGDDLTNEEIAPVVQNNPNENNPR